MKNLIIYYSLEGNTKLIAETVASSLKADLFELVTEKKMTTGLMKYFWGGKQVLMKEKPAILPLDKNLADYDTIIFGTPVWAGTYAPPLATFFSQHKISGKRVALFCCCGGTPSRTFVNLKAALAGNTFIGEIYFQDPLRKNKDQNIATAVDWSQKLVA